MELLLPSLSSFLKLPNVASFESHSVFDFWCNLRSIQKELGLKSSMISLPVEHDNQEKIHGEVFIGGDQNIHLGCSI